jgi:hypothetical protein
MIAAGLLITSIGVYGSTTIVLEDGTVVETNDRVYVSKTPLFQLEEAEALVGGESVIPELGTPEWCEWYEAANPDGISPDFSEEHSVYVRNCR